MKRKSKNLDFEINLVPFIDLLSVCICFLLLTAVWMQYGTFSVDQALGTESAAEKKATSSIWIEFENDGTLTVMLKNNNTIRSKTSIRNVNDKQKVERIATIAQKWKQTNPEINTALLLPAAQSPYESVIAVMDVLRKTKINDIGVAPL